LTALQKWDVDALDLNFNLKGLEDGDVSVKVTVSEVIDNLEYFSKFDQIKIKDELAQNKIVPVTLS
jgi:hypothetical protein